MKKVVAAWLCLMAATLIIGFGLWLFGPIVLGDSGGIIGSSTTTKIGIFLIFFSFVNLFVITVATYADKDDKQEDKQENEKEDEKEHQDDTI